MCTKQQWLHYMQMEVIPTKMKRVLDEAEATDGYSHTERISSEFTIFQTQSERKRVCKEFLFKYYTINVILESLFSHS
jgi:hypothetical protein